MSIVAQKQQKQSQKIKTGSILYPTITGCLGQSFSHNGYKPAIKIMLRNTT